ncbi:sucrose transport protein SUC4 isoform X3 [Pistacia vera]|uniref:sucrose transport protein SUC4 isoform X3 n=1 Tax=Pistacia vera TaxID=55513 RepID=UPI00126341D3|nr:sucrose transport protein SUC4 isoform X3 [Pistacia vera]
MPIAEAERHRGRERPSTSRPAARPPARAKVPLRQLLKVASVACGIQFGWALQLSLLTPYVQELGIPHAWASIIWLCGPLSGLLVQPLVGHLSDRCTSRFGRRRPFIVAGSASIAVAVLLIGHSADIGWLLGDRGDYKPRAIAVFVFGFWILDVANNMTQGPCRALLADLTAKEVPLGSRDRSAPFAEEGHEHSGQAEEAFLWQLFGTFRYFSGTIWIILFVTALTWIGWFPFLLFDTDWVGREVYGGKPNEGQNYNSGVRMGALGLMLNSVVLGITSVFMEKICRKWGAGFVWGLSDILMALCFLAMILISFVAKNMDYIGHDLPPDGIVIAALIIFTILGVPLAITYSVPYALISTRIEALGLGQGLSLGVLNLAIVIPQVVVSVGSGPWDQLLGGGNSPAFAVGAIAAFAGGLIGVLAIPRSSTQKPRAMI